MSKKRNAPEGIWVTDLAYLAGVWDATPGLRGTNTNNAVAISKDPEWIKSMAEWFGGEARQFTSGAGKTYWGWYLPLDLRLKMLDVLESDIQDGAVSQITATPVQIDSIRGKLTKAIDKHLYGKGA